ncbi:MAG: DUF4256 domain-containing protein [Bacilli bacterium]|nr:DUF4256 domain-containing protein [Bacilli bacterium]
MEKEEFIRLWQKRFLSGYMKHPEVDMSDVVSCLKKAENINVLLYLEEAGGEVDLVKADEDYYYFFDCCKESPLSRRGLCYDEAAYHARKDNPPRNSVERRAKGLSAHILREEDFRLLCSLGEFDLKSQDWLKTDDDFRSNGDAIFGCKRSGRAFVFYNSAECAFKNRGFRCKVKVARK